MKFGARVLKTGIAITVALYIADILGMQSPVFAGIAATFAIQPSIYRSYITLLEQIQANIIGAIVAIGFVITFGNNPVLIGIAVILVIASLRFLKIENTISIATVTVIAIMIAPGDDFYSFAILRFVTIMIGIISSFVVNVVFLPPRFEQKLYSVIVELTSQVLQKIRMNINQLTNQLALQKEIMAFKDGAERVDHFYRLFSEEPVYSYKKLLRKTRKLVLYRQFVKTMNISLDLLKHLHRLRKEIEVAPEHLKLALREEIEQLLKFHEQLLYKLTGVTKVHTETDFQEELQHTKISLADTYMSVPTCKDCPEWLSLFPLVGTIVFYAEQLEHLDRLLESSQTYHKKDTTVELPPQDLSNSD
ncbi:MAG: FUSC family protein [Bacilli bacterium]